MDQTKKNTALLVMDMQDGILPMLPGSNDLVSIVSKAIAHARQNKIPVIYAAVGFRAGSPEVSLNNKSFMATKERFANVNMDDFMKIDSRLSPLPDEVKVSKRRVSSFTGSDLEVVLRAQTIQHIVLAGVSTSGVVLSTVREAADKDYRITVLSDACADGDEEVHRVLMTKIFPRQADVISTEEWLSA